MQQKACAIVLRHTADGAQVLMFQHPLAGVQLVKGGIHPGETPNQAAIRELREESGLIAQHATHVTSIDFDDLQQRWHICICAVPDAQDHWSFKTADDDGQTFTFFWHNLHRPYPNDMGQTYRKVLNGLQAATSSSA